MVANNASAQQAPPEPPQAGAFSTFVTAGNQTLGIDFLVEDLIHLRHQAVAARRVEPVITHLKSGATIPARAFARLSDDEVEIIDRATIEFAATLAGPDGSSVLPVILPISFRTVSARRGRSSLAAATEGSAEALKKRIIVELIDIDRGTPTGRLTEVAGLLNAICRGVFARLQPTRDVVFPVRDARLQGVTIDAADLAPSDTDAAGQLLEFAGQARGLAPLLVAQGLPNDGYFAVAEVAGYTHGSLRPRA
ncbi:hypothetical protein [Phenylobacterium sp.]|uniref:hypothetical protein n=1 Tax=Phenylobacterium sp. TaxID=1871053 RepID=UPI002736DFF0|nr:hypothetical protein [Phenylobacterium sp.]MDP3854044.1 hypothetical protein [Phenylobacterium sp.]